MKLLSPRSGPLALCCALALTLAGAAHAAGPPITLRLCVDETPQFPWRLPQRSKGEAPRGLDFVLLGMAAQRVGVKLEFALLPWKRCLAELPQGKHDGLVAVSFKPERAALGVFPMLGSEADESLRMSRESYSLYTLRGQQALAWDGKRVTLTAGDRATQVFGAQSGYSVADQLRRMGLKVDDGARGVDANLDKLLKRRVHAVALVTGDGDGALRREARWADAVQRIDPPLDQKSYYLLFSRGFFNANEAVARRLWAGLAAARESAEFRRAEAELVLKR